MNAAPRMQSEPAPSRRQPPRSDHSGAADVDADIVAAVEAQLAAQRAELTAKLVAEKAERRRQEQEAAAARKAEAEREAARAAAAAEEKRTTRGRQGRGGRLADAAAEARIARLENMLAVAVMKLSPTADVEPRASQEKRQDVPENDYSDTERVQLELNALMDLLGVVRVKDVQEHVVRDDGSIMSPSNVRYHMKKLANRGEVKKVEERYYINGLGWRTRDVWSKDAQKLLEVLEGKKTVRS
jgi:hypothetical protein